MRENAKITSREYFPPLGYTQTDINFIFTDQCLQGQIRPCAKKRKLKLKVFVEKTLAA